jgi:hypothetical protein
MIHKAVLFAAVGLFALPLAGSALAAGATEIELLGKDPGSAAAYSCFTRHYDQAHLAAHPRQNVRDMSVFVESTYDKDTGRENYFEIGVGFRGLLKPFQIDGNCSTTTDGKKALSCGGDCDGGHFDVSTRGSNTILVAIPDYVRLWDPNANADDPPDDLPKGAEFGKDDKLFRLDRADVKACQSLMSDDARHALFGTPLPADDASAPSDDTAAPSGDIATKAAGPATPATGAATK